MALSWFRSYLEGRGYYVSIGEHKSKWTQVPQGSILAPHLFSLYMVPLSQIMRENQIAYHSYADDTQIYLALSPNDYSPIDSLCQCIDEINSWMCQSFLQLNKEKTEVIAFGSKEEVLKVNAYLDSRGQTTKNQVRNLGVILESDLSFSSHVKAVTKSAYCDLKNIARIRCFVSSQDLEKLVHAFITSRVDYCNGLLTGLPKTTIRQLQLIQNAAARILTRTRKSEHITPVLRSLHWLPVGERSGVLSSCLKMKGLSNSTDSFIKLSIHLEFPLPLMALTPVQLVESGKLPPTAAALQDWSSPPLLYTKELDQLIVPVDIDCWKGHALVDTGSSYTLLNENLWLIMGYHPQQLKPWTEGPIYLADGGARQPLAWGEVKLTLQALTVTLPVVVLASQMLAFPVVLGLDYLFFSDLQLDIRNNVYWFQPDQKYAFLKNDVFVHDWHNSSPLALFSALPPVKFNEEPDPLQVACQNTWLDEIGKERFFRQLQQNSDVCTDVLGKTSVLTHRIYVTQDVPIKQKPYRVSPTRQKVIKQLIDKMIEADVIEPSSSAWASPLVLIPKKTGGYRFCVDYRKLNSVTQSDAYPLPTIQEILESLSGAVVFSTLDLNSGYWQVRMEKDSQDKTAFICNQGLFHFKAMAFGLKNAPATFQRLMERVLGELQRKNCLVYLDDIIIYSPSVEQHFLDIQAVLDKLKEAHLTVNMKKTHFFRSSLKFLGHIVSAEGIQADPEKTRAVQEFPVPRNIKEVQQFLGMAGWYHRFVPCFSQVAEPLNALKRKGVKFVWSAQCQDAFNTLKQLLVSPPVLGHPNLNLPFVVYTDASEIGLGAVLVQQTGLGTEEVLAYASRTLNQAEKNYSTTEQECLAVKPNTRLIRWALRLQEFNFTVEYRKGKYNTIPDALSRAPLDIQESGILTCSAVLSSKSKSEKTEPLPLQITDYDIWKAQQTDSDIQNLYEQIVESGEITVNGTTKFTILEDKVYRVVQFPHRTVYQVYIPKALRFQLLQTLHEDPLAGHLGQFKTCKRLQALVYWPNLNQTVKEFVQNCHTCQLYKPECRKLPGSLQQTIVQRPWEMLGMDLMGPFPRSSSGNVFMLVFVDYYSRWVELFSLRKATAETVSQILVREIFTRWGVPDYLLSDRGPQFVSSVFQELCKTWNIEHKMTTAYHPQTNLTERMNRTLKTMVASYVNDNHKHWDKLLPEFRFALNSAVHESTGVTPAELNLNQSLRGPMDVLLQPQDVCPEDSCYDKVTELHQMKEYVEKRLHTARQRQKRNYDKNRREVEFKEKDRVWMRANPYSKACRNGRDLIG
ncbi:Retrovirus-related Pol polyprotein [Labeo rohita]|uniref:Gypsy retrotransposon integrase-like protein 1 n=1 Tax=Labeo rohita TaxID=84645 RepID=A0ABQ8MNQ4_LABRO|nr:Retrovirus-related Pol polyprotein [Labeo rohita]